MSKTLGSVKNRISKYNWILDKLKEETERGITVDISRFETVNFECTVKAGPVIYSCNRMDARYDETVKEISLYLQKVGYNPDMISFFPISGFEGETTNRDRQIDGIDAQEAGVVVSFSGLDLNEMSDTATDAIQLTDRVRRRLLGPKFKNYDPFSPLDDVEMIVDPSEVAMQYERNREPPRWAKAA